MRHFIARHALLATLTAAALAAALGAASVAHAALPPQIVVYGHAGRAASMSSEGGDARSVYVFWDASEGRLEDLIPAGSTLTLKRDGAVIRTFGLSDVATAEQIAALYAGPTQARRKAETLAILDKAFESDGAPLPPTSNGPMPADVDPTPTTFPTVLRSVLLDPAWEPVVAMLTKIDPNVAVARNRAHIEPIAPTTADWVTYQLVATSSNGVDTVVVGEVVVDTSSDYVAGPAEGLRDVTAELFRCDSNDWGRAHGTVALNWDHPGVGPGLPVVNQVLTTASIVGYETWVAPGACPNTLDLATALRSRPFEKGGAVSLPGFRRVSAEPMFITSPAPDRVPEGPEGYVSTWRPAFAQLHELAPALQAVGLRPGDPACYAVAARDRTGNLGTTRALSTRVGDFMPPETPWNVTAVTQSVMSHDGDAPGDGLVDTKALWIEWPHVSVDNWIWSFATTHGVCDAASARATGRLAFAVNESAARCSDPKAVDEVRLDVARYLVYRFDTAHAADSFGDADGDGIADTVERLVDTDGDRVGDYSEAAFTSEELQAMPVSDVGAACTPAATPVPPRVAVVRAADAEVGEDGRQVLRFVDDTPIADRAQAYWYRIAAVTADGRISRPSPPIRAAFPDMTKPPPFDLGPGGDAAFTACETMGFQDDTWADLEPDSPEYAGGAYDPIIITVPEEPRDFIGHRILGVDLTGEAVSMRITCLDEDLLERGRKANNQEDVDAMVAMRLASYVGSIPLMKPLDENIAGQLPYVVPATGTGAPVGFSWMSPAEQSTLCQALTRKAYTAQFIFGGEGGGIEVSQTCTPHVEFLDRNGRPLAPPAPMVIRDDQSESPYTLQPCALNPFAPGCEEFACNFTAVLDDTRCERVLDDDGEVVTGGVQVAATLQKGECAYLELEQEFPTFDAQGTVVSVEVEAYRVGWQCCDQPSCTVFEKHDTGDFGKDMVCYSLTRTHDTSKGAPNTLSSTRTPGPCVNRVPKDPVVNTPAPPRILQLAVPAAQTTGTLSWTAPDEAIGGIVVELWKEGAAANQRKTIFLPARGRYGPNNPKIDSVSLDAVLPDSTIERWCVTARSVGLAPPTVGSAGQLSTATAPLCVERKADAVPLPEYIQWPVENRPGSLGSALKVEYLKADGVPFVSVAKVDALDDVPDRLPDFEARCQTLPDDCGCRPQFACDPTNPEQTCLARPTIEGGDVNSASYYWHSPNQPSGTPDSEVASRCSGFCRDALTKFDFRRVVVYRRSRATASPSTVGPYVQVSEFIHSPTCFFSRKHFRSWRPLLSHEGPVLFGMDDPNFVIMDMDRSATGGDSRSMEVLWLDRHPHAAGRDYQYQFVYFDDRGEIAGYRDSNWIVHSKQGPYGLDVWNGEVP